MVGYPEANRPSRVRLPAISRLLFTDSSRKEFKYQMKIYKLLKDSLTGVLSSSQRGQLSCR